MKRNYSTVLVATALALAALLVSQSLWINNAARQTAIEQELSFKSCFNQSISTVVNGLTGKGGSDAPYSIEKVDDAEFEALDESRNPVKIYAGNKTDGDNVSIMIENALIVLYISNGTFRLSGLEALVTGCLSDRGSVVLSRITLHDVRENKVMDEARQDGISPGSPFFVKTYVAERHVEVPGNSYLIRAEYRIKQPGNLRKMGIAAIASLTASVIIISVLFYLLFTLRRRHAELSNMERSFHGAIHDLKSPLAYVYFSLSSLEEQETDMAKKTALSLMADRVTFLSGKIMRILLSGRDIHAIGKTGKETVYLYDILEQIETEMRTMFPAKNIVFENNLDAELSVYVMPDLFEAAIRTIIENAVKYNGGAPRIAISAVRNVDDVIISVSDNGEGMTKQQLKRIFEPYYTSDRKQGSGIGLYYAGSIVKAHGGTISVESVPGQGSTFTLTIPNR